MKTIHIHQTDAFTNKIFGGNPAGVAVDADILSTEEMKDIAREMNLSETAFVLQPTQQEADFKLRYFTSAKAEIKFCGHATIASLYELGRTSAYGMSKAGRYAFRVETNAGILPMEVIKKAAAGVSVRFSAPNVTLEPYSIDFKDFAKRFGIPASAIDQKQPIMIDRNLNYIYMAIKSLKDLGELTFDFQRVMDNFRDENIVVFCLLTAETFDEENTIHARGLAPLVGVPEDPFTGSMQAGLATYARQNGLIDSSADNIRVEQGHFIERPGFAEIQIPLKANDPYHITGHAVHVFSTDINL